MIASFFENLRARPYHERRILAVSLFIAASAIVCALGVTSLAQSINLSPRENALPSAGESEQAKPKAEALTSPFQALRQSFRDLVDGFKSVSDATHELASAIEKSAAATTTPPAYALPVGGSSLPTALIPPPNAVTKPVPPAAKPAPASAPKKENFASVTASAYDPASHDDAVETSITPPSAPEDPARTGARARLHTFLQTFQNAYNALRE